MKFISSLELSRMICQQEIVPILARSFPDLSYAAATFGICSEILAWTTRSRWITSGGHASGSFCQSQTTSAARAT